jgi:hypothetical protein
MNKSRYGGVKFGVLLALALLALAAVGLLLRQGATAVSADSPPPPLPPFTGEAATAVLADPAPLAEKELVVPEAQLGWNVVLSETFEAGLNPMIWTALDNNGLNHGEYYWGTRAYTNTTPGGTRSAWAIGAGEDGGSLDPAVDGYPPNVDSWLIYGPVDLTEVVDGVVSFNYWLESDAGDEFGLFVSTNGTSYAGVSIVSGGTGGWTAVNYDLGSYAGSSTLYLAFRFASNANANPANLRGAFLDDVQLHLRFLDKTYLPLIRKDPTPTFTPTPTLTPSPTPTNTPSPTPTITPTPTATPITAYYFDNFNDPFATNWAMRRTNTAAWIIEPLTQQGIIQLNVDSPESNLLVSPLVAAPSSRNYTIETVARFVNPQNLHTYGVVFAGDLIGQPCPNNNFTSCFNQYYYLRVQWRNDAGTFLEYKLSRVDQHDSNNNPIPITLIDWMRVSAPPNEWNRWNIVVRSNGDITVLLNNQWLGTINDSAHLGNFGRYFGISAYTRNNPFVRAQFDYFKIEED